MSGLKRRILAVVGEGQQFARVLGEVRRIAVHPVQDAGDQDCRRRTPALAAQRREFVDVAGGRVGNILANRTETELAGHEPASTPHPAIAVRRHVMKAGPAFAVGRLQAPVAALRLFQPCLRIIFVVALEREFGVGGLGHQKAPLGAFVLLVRLNGDVVDLPLLEILAPPVGPQRDRVKFLTAVPAEMDRVQAFFLVVRIEYLPRKRHVALAFGAKGRIQAPRAGDELMELEGEQRLAASVGYTAPVLRSAEPDQGVPERRRADVLG